MTEAGRRRLFTVVCTDRGQHPQRRITFTGHGPANAAGTQIGTQRRRGARWHCNTCGRTVELTAEKWLRLRDGLESAGVSQVDISRIPGV